MMQTVRRRPHSASRPLRISVPLATAVLLTAGALTPGAVAAAGDEPGLGPPPLYDELRAAEPEPAGHIRGGRLWIDRFEFELQDGDLYLVPPVGGHSPVAVYLGRGTVRAWPPDGVEHQQLRKLIDQDFLEEEFERFVFWFSGDLDERLRALVTEPPPARGGRRERRQRERAADLLEDRREALLEDRLRNPDARVALDLWQAASGLAAPDRPCFFAEIDGREHDWFSIEIEPLDLEEVAIGEFDRRRKITDVWMGFHALDEFEPETREATVGRFPRDPEAEGPVDPDAERNDDEWSFRDYGLSPRLLVPDRERWFPRVQISRTDVDMAIESNGDAKASVALVVEPLAPLSGLRLRVSPFADVADVRWRLDLPSAVDDVTRVALLAPGRAPRDAADGAEPDAADDEPPGPDEPAAIAGERIHYVQETHDRRFDEDLHDPWLIVLLPRPVAAGERFVLEISYEAELVERLRDASGYLLKDTIYWIPRHPDNRKRRFDLTFRVPERLRVASGGALAGERVEDDTRIMRWTTTRPVRGDDVVPHGAVRRGRGDARGPAPGRRVRGPQPPWLRARQPREDPGRPLRVVAHLHRLLRSLPVRFPAGHRDAGNRRTGVSRFRPADVPGLRRHAHGRVRAVPRARGGPPVVGRGGGLGVRTATSGSRRASPTTRPRSTRWRASATWTSSGTCSTRGGWTPSGK